MARRPHVQVERHQPTGRPKGPADEVRRLTVGAVDDPAELEADRLAGLAMAAQADWSGGVARRAEPAGGAGGAFDIPADALAAGSPGRPLDDDVRRRMEGGFGADFSAVRVHDGTGSARLSRSLAARAFTHGTDIHFGAGEYRPGTVEGDHVLAHELAHVVQAGGAARSAPLRRFPRTALAGATDWAGQTGGVSRPGEGASGGVYVLTAKDPNAELTKVVVKPVFGENGMGTKETGEQMVFGDRALSAFFGIGTPVSRVVQRGTAEFDGLVALCNPKAPPKPAPGTLAAENWKPLPDAASFVVMSEVLGDSVSSLASKAGKDQGAARDLYRAVFDDDVLVQLGQLYIADLLLGNIDRMGRRAMNLGNVMVSMTGDRPKVFAIDTNAVLDRFDPAQVAKQGSASSTMDGGFTGARGLFESEPGEYLDGFMGVVVGKVRAGAKDAAGPENGRLSPADLIESTYQANRSAYVATFEHGWREALIKVFELVNTKEGKQQMKGLTGEYAGTAGEAGLRYTALKTNAMYLAGKAEGKTHDEASEDPARYAAIKVLEQFDPATVRIPTDEYYWTVGRVLPGNAASADLPSIDGIEVPRRITDAFGETRKRFDYQQGEFDCVAANASHVRAAADSLGTKSRGLFGKTEGPRNRTLAMRFVAETYQLGIGAARAMSRAGRLLDVLNAAQMAVGGEIKKSRAARALPAAEFVRDYLPRVQRDAVEYSESLREAAKGVRKLRKYEERKRLGDVLDRAARIVTKDGEELERVAKLQNPSRLVDALKSVAG